MRSRRLLILAAPTLSLILTGCASMRVNSYTERGAALDRYRTFDWAPGDPQPTGDPRLDSNPFFDARVRAAVDRQLGRKGFAKAPGGRADLLVRYHASISQRIDAAEIDRYYDHADGAAARARAYDAGTLIIDLVDAGTNRLVWRGWAEDSLDGVVERQDWLDATIDEAVERILARLAERGR